jgi:hypothetical protein
MIDEPVTNPAETAGPNLDGSKSLARESKFGAVTTALVSALLFAVADWMGELDVSPLPDWMENSATAALAVISGLIVAYLTRNGRARRYARRQA